MRISVLAAVIATLLIGAPAGAATIPENITAAVADGSRPDPDKERDSNRKPAETLAFAGVRPADQFILKFRKPAK